MQHKRIKRSASRESSAPLSESTKAHRLLIPVAIEREIGLDLENEPAHRQRRIAATHCLMMCESLFWTIQRLGNMAQDGARIYTEDDLFEALDNLGELGKAIASAATEQVECLERAVSGVEGKVKGSD